MNSKSQHEVLCNFFSQWQSHIHFKLRKTTVNQAPYKSDAAANIVGKRFCVLFELTQVP